MYVKRAISIKQFYRLTDQSEMDSGPGIVWYVDVEWCTVLHRVYSSSGGHCCGQVPNSTFYIHELAYVWFSSNHTIIRLSFTSKYNTSLQIIIQWLLSKHGAAKCLTKSSFCEQSITLLSMINWLAFSFKRRLPLIHP